MLLFFFFSLSFHSPPPPLLSAVEALIYLGPGERDASRLLYLSVPGQQQVSPMEDDMQQIGEGALKGDCPAFWQSDHNCLYHLKVD